ncbi:MAG: hypothetical protein IJT19_08950 [Bacteroidaceae bacterium]|nr:hypothetical protein [Bacteroidaceae bacterium]
MRKIKLLLAAVAAMVGLGTSAQSWTASAVASGTYLLYNVGTEAYFTKGNGWGSQASITTDRSGAMSVGLYSVSDKHVIITDYTTKYGLEYLTDGTVYTDQSRNKNSTWTFTQVDTDNGPIYNIISADNHGGGSGTYLTAEGGSSTIVGSGTDGTADNAKWKLLSLATDNTALITSMADATEENPLDVTALIEDATFDSYVKSAWWTVSSSNHNLAGGDASNRCAESWCASFTISQTITVPNGYYRCTWYSH